MKFQAVVAAASVATAFGHGHLSSPASRTEIAYQNGQDYCPHCTLEDVGAPPGTGGRPYPGSRPFAEPGQATLSMGPCGRNGGNNYNAPGGSWGGIQETYQAGQIIDFESCWQADHKGTYSMRVCPDDALVARFTTPGVSPSSSEESQLEQCFQDNILPCTGVNGNRGCDALAVGSGCQAGWGCASNTDWFYSPNAGAFNDGSCSTGFGTKDQVQLPQGFSSNHTLLSWRWDALDTSQLYTGCVDVSIAPSGGFPTLPPTEAPPTSAPPAPTPAPAPTPPAGPCVDHYQQCGGIGWAGATECCDGRTCEFGNDYYSQCL